MPWGAAIAAVGAIGGAAISSSASKSAADQQSAAANNAADASLQEYNQTRNDQAPYRSAGNNALAALQYGLGLGGTTGGGVAKTQDNFDPQAYLAANPDVAAYIAANPGQTNAWQHYQDFGQNEGRAFTYTPAAQAQVTAASTNGGTGTAGAATNGGYGSLLRNFTMADFQADPGTQFVQDQGEKAINRGALAAGRYNTGATLKSLDTFNTGLANQTYQTAYDRYNTNQSKQFNELSGLAGTGQTATNATDSAGLAATNSANNYLTSGAAAGAAGTVGAANAYSSGINNGLNYWQGQQVINALRKPTYTPSSVYDPSDPYNTNANSNGWT